MHTVKKLQLPPHQKFLFSLSFLSFFIFFLSFFKFSYHKYKCRLWTCGCTLKKTFLWMVVAKMESNMESSQIAQCLPRIGQSQVRKYILTDLLGNAYLCISACFCKVFFHKTKVFMLKCSLNSPSSWHSSHNKRENMHLKLWGCYK